MEEATRSALGAELGATPPEFLDELDEAELRDLTDALAEARARQADAVEEAIERALRFVPWVLRGTVRKVLIG